MLWLIEKIFFDQPIKNYEKKRLGKLLLVKEMITKIINWLDLSKEQALDVNSREIQQINFKANLGIAGNTRMHFILEEAKETVLDFSQGIVKVSWIQFHWVI